MEKIFSDLELRIQDLNSEKLNLIVDIQDTKTTIWDIKSGEWDREQLEKYLIMTLENSISYKERLLKEIEGKIKGFQTIEESTNKMMEQLFEVKSSLKEIEQVIMKK